MTALITGRPEGDAGAIGRVLAAPRPPAPPGPFAASLVFGWRALLKIRHVPEPARRRARPSRPPGAVGPPH
jgi:hypothetical protein